MPVQHSCCIPNTIASLRFHEMSDKPASGHCGALLTTAQGCPACAPHIPTPLGFQSVGFEYLEGISGKFGSSMHNSLGACSSGVRRYPVYGSTVSTQALGPSQQRNRDGSVCPAEDTTSRKRERSSRTERPQRSGVPTKRHRENVDTVAPVTATIGVGDN